MVRVRKVEEEGDKVNQIVAERCGIVERMATEEVSKVREEAKRRDLRFVGEMDEVKWELHRVKVDASNSCERIERERN